ncbi:hypothetical protein GCM10009804_52540 [Kribbella hippodromi]|uniref:Uncharacterized protein n=1 Tax=Kribbella hippodromi TaxID=434347 RepID=A0ABN2DZA3_9ACTN
MMRRGSRVFSTCRTKVRPKDPVPPVTRMSEPVRIDTRAEPLLTDCFGPRTRGADLETIAAPATTFSIPVSDSAASGLIQCGLSPVPGGRPDSRYGLGREACRGAM